MAPTITKPTQPNYNIALITSTMRNSLSNNNPVTTEADCKIRPSQIYRTSDKSDMLPKKACTHAWQASLFIST